LNFEGYFNEELSGKSGLIKSIRDALGALVTIGPRSVKKAEDGVDLVLTIDRHIQFTACQKLKEFYDYFEADSGTVIIMKPTGAITAMCSFPDFNPEKYNWGPFDFNLYDLSESERNKIDSLPRSLNEALDALENDYEYLLQGNVFPKRLIDIWITEKRLEARRIDNIPHPAEFKKYYDF